ncbi:MAG TPA: MlaD family protein [Thermoleophilaceae bacterium]|jgi:phospholipid/cholesterol/gamma-HCH transport system substrate-binding protein
MRSVSRVGRVAAIGAVIVAAVVVGFVLFGAGHSYTVDALFQDGGQLVKGNLVEVAGVKAGSVKGISITPNGQAKIKMAIDGAYAPLPQNTKAVIRQASQSGYANRYVELDLPGGPSKGQPKIPDGGTLTEAQTTATVDIDQLFNTLDPSTRKALQNFFKGSAAQYKGVTRQANVALHYLNPELSTSSRLFNELNRDTPVLEHFLGDSAHLVTAVAQKRDDLAALVQNLNTTTHAIGSQKAALADSIGRLPDFMRNANTTFVNLRAALNDVDPLVNASKPVAKKLKPFLDQVQPLARDARPTIAGLNTVIQHGGANNDLVDLTNTLTPLAHIAVDTAQRDGANRQGAFPESTTALKNSAPIIAFGRPYTPDLFGWFDDFSTTGNYDALGQISRTQVVFNPLSPDLSVLSALGLNGKIPANLPLQLGQSGNSPVPASLQGQLVQGLVRTEQFKRCPGAGDVVAPDKSNLLSSDEQQQLGCTEADRGAGDYSPGG